MYKLLFVDDDKALLKMLENYFRLRGYRILLAEDGLEALKRIEDTPDLILLDINMPPHGWNGAVCENQGICLMSHSVSHSQSGGAGPGERPAFGG